MAVSERPSGRARVLIVGSGAREHALAWALSRSPSVGRIYCAPGNPGIGALATLLPVSASDVAGLVAGATDLAVDLVVVGPEAPLVGGLVDALAQRGVEAAGPSRAGAALEGSKAFAKTVMAEASIPTAPYRLFESAGEAAEYVSRAPLPLVVKADGPAAGKGVSVCASREAALDAVDAAIRRRVFGPAGDRILIEECLEGEEVSVLALTDGRQVCVLPPAQDHKRLLDGDAGPNTGGMGAVAPSPALSQSELDVVRRTILEPAIGAMAQRGTPYRGVIYAGLMRGPAGICVLEFNCRFGDPEAQVLLPLLESDLYELLAGTASGCLDNVAPRWSGGVALGVTLAAAGYPNTPELGAPIAIRDDLPDDILLFHGGTGRDASGRLVVAGGRVATVVARADNVAEARARCLPPPVTFEGMQYRRDIGARALNAQAGVELAMT